MENNNIGIFDSGIGGITVLKEIVKVLPNYNYIYYSDSKNNPYGDKSDEEIISICDNVVKYLLDKGYKNIIFVAIEPAYKMVFDYAYNDSTLVMATKATIESEKFNMLYEKYNNHKTILLPCVGLADIIENGNNEEIKKYLIKKLGKYKGKIKNVVLGCTHYPLIQEQIQEVLGNVRFFNGASRVAEHLKNILDNEKIQKNQTGEIKFIDSQNSKIKEERFISILNNNKIIND